MNIRQLWQTRSAQKQIDALFRRLLRMEFRGRDLDKLARYFAEKPSKNHEGKYRELDESIWNMAVSECWEKLLSSDGSIPAMMAASPDSPEEAGNNVSLLLWLCRMCVQKFASAVRDDERDKSYAGLREAIVRMRNQEGERAFICKDLKEFGETGVIYSTRPVEIPYACFDWEQLAEPLAGLEAPPVNIRKIKKGAGKNSDGSVQVWSWSALLPVATRFWNAFVARHYGGKAGFVPVYALYRWLCKYFELGRMDEASLNEPIDDEDGNQTTRQDLQEDENQASMEDEILKKEMDSLAENFTCGLSNREKIACAILYGEEDGTLMAVAKATNAAGPSSADRFKRSLLHKISSFFASHPEIAEEDGSKEYFINMVVEMCKKSALSPIVASR